MAKDKRNSLVKPLYKALNLLIVISFIRKMKSILIGFLCIHDILVRGFLKWLGFFVFKIVKTLDSIGSSVFILWVATLSKNFFIFILVNRVNKLKNYIPVSSSTANVFLFFQIHLKLIFPQLFFFIKQMRKSDK